MDSLKKLLNIALISLAAASIASCDASKNCPAENVCSYDLTETTKEGLDSIDKVDKIDDLEDFDSVSDISDNLVDMMDIKITDLSVNSEDINCRGNGIPFCNGPKQILVQECNEPYSEIKKCDIIEHCDQGECISNIDCDFHKDFGYDIIESVNPDIDGKCCTIGDSGDHLCLKEFYSYKITNTWDYGPKGAKGIVWTGEKIFCINSNVSGEIYKFDTDGNFEDSVKTHSTDGITWAENNLWITFKEPWEHIYGFHRISTDFQTDYQNKVVLLDEILTETYHLLGLTWDGNNFWVLENGHNGTQDLINKIEINECIGEIAYSIKSNNEHLRGLDYKNGLLWTCDSIDNKILAFNLAGDVVNYFNSPVDSNKGLTWQGSDLWLTNFSSYYDNILKLELIKNE